MGMLRRRHEERHALEQEGVEVQRDEIDADNTAETEPLEGVDDTRDKVNAIDLADTTVHHGTRGNVNPVGGESDDDALELKGEALDDALMQAGLSKSGTADVKRQRLADHRAVDQRTDMEREADEQAAASRP